MRIQRLEYAKPTASSLSVAGVKATSSRRAPVCSHDKRKWRDLDAGDRTRTAERVAAPEIVAQEHGSPKIEVRRMRTRTHDRRLALELRSSSRVLQCAYACMQKDFDRWNKKKKALDANEAEPLFFREGDIWWVHLGVNIGYEIDGKQNNFARPVIVLRKYNKYSFLALPLTTRATPSPYKISVGAVAGKQAFAVVSQLRNIDSRRLYQKLARLAPDLLQLIRNETFRINSTSMK